jgi:hypothetical protein
MAMTAAAWTSGMPSACFVQPHRHPRATSTSSSICSRTPSLKNSNSHNVGVLRRDDNDINDSRRLFSILPDNNHDESVTSSDTDATSMMSSLLFQDRRAFLSTLGATTGVLLLNSNHHDDAVALAETADEDPLDAFGKALSETGRGGGGGAWPASNVSPLPLPSTTRRGDSISSSSSASSSSVGSSDGDDDDDDSSVSSAAPNGLEEALQRMQNKRSINPLTHG